MIKIIGMLALFLLLIFVSCNKSNAKKYYENGALKELHIYKKDKDLDSTIIFYSPPSNKKIKEIRIWNKNTGISKNFDTEGKLIFEGYFNPDPKVRIGNWTFFEKNHDSIVEYVKVNGESFTNQIWLIDRNGDTLETRGNFFYFNVKDTVSVGEVVRLNFFLMCPSNSYNSELEVILPTDDEDLAKDFSNLLEIERDTFPSLKNDNIPHPEIPKAAPTNHWVVFGLEYSTPGVKRLRGVLVEYSDRNSNDLILPDSINRLERRLYFDKSIYVKDARE